MTEALKKRRKAYGASALVLLAFLFIGLVMLSNFALRGLRADLTENGLYTLEAWTTFLDRLRPDGIFTVSRWYAPGELNETGRMVSLATASLFESGIASPRRHLFLASSGHVATLLLSRSPFGPEPLAAIGVTMPPWPGDGEAIVVPGEWRPTVP